MTRRTATEGEQVFRLKEGQPMLVLTRKVGEKVVIGDDVVLTVLEVSGHKLRVGVEAPDHVPVVRAELLLRSPAEAGGPEVVGR
jgi:carbon storage regulator